MFGKKKTDKNAAKKEEKAKVEPKKPGVIKKSFKWAFGSFFNVSGWSGYSVIKDSSLYLVGVTKKIFMPDKATRTESFEEALARLGLKEKDLKRKEKDMMRLCIIYVTFAIAIICYALYLAFSGAILAFLLCLLLAMIALTFAFRFHFWIFQIQHRKLGCTLKEWYTSSPKGENE